MKTKTFDCVEMKRQGARILQERLAGLTREQQLAFWQDQFKQLQDRKESRRVRSGTK